MTYVPKTMAESRRRGNTTSDRIFSGVPYYNSNVYNEKEFIALGFITAIHT